MRRGLIRKSFLLGMVLALQTLVYTTSSLGQPQTTTHQKAAKTKGVTVSGHVISSGNGSSKKFSADSILIRFKTGASASEKSAGRQKVKGKKLHSFSMVPGLEHMQIGTSGLEVEKAIQILERLPIVEYAHPNYVITANKTIPNDAQFSEQWALYNIGQSSTLTTSFDSGAFGVDIGATRAWEVVTASNKPVAIIDSGIGYDHPDLVNNIWTNYAEYKGIPGVDDDGNGYVDDIHGWNFVNNNNDPYDDNGHGSHIAGIVAAQGNNGVSIANYQSAGIDMGACGVLWRGQLMALKILDDEGNGLLSDAIAALQYAVHKGVRVSNNSWGYYGKNVTNHQALYDAILASQAENHIFIAAAGNGDNNGSTGYNTDVVPNYPSSFDLNNIISVAATDNNGNLAYFSNYGQKSVDLAAPGVAIFSTYIFPESLSWGYYWISGTSMAAPHVTGVAAMLTELYPDWSYNQIRDQILTTVQRPEMDGSNPLAGKTVTGGIVNAANAVTSTRSLPPAILLLL